MYHVNYVLIIGNQSYLWSMSPPQYYITFPETCVPSTVALSEGPCLFGAHVTRLLPSRLCMQVIISNIDDNNKQLFISVLENGFCLF